MGLGEKEGVGSGEGGWVYERQGVRGGDKSVCKRGWG